MEIKPMKDIELEYQYTLAERLNQLEETFYQRLVLLPWPEFSLTMEYCFGSNDPDVIELKEVLDKYTGD